MKALFDIKETPQEAPKKKRGRPRKNPIVEEQPTPVELAEQPKKKRGRPKKVVTVEPQPILEVAEQPKKRRGRPPKEKTLPVEEVPKKQEPTIQKDEPEYGWKPYTKYVDIDPLTPCMFMVKTSEKRFKIFYGYLDLSKRVVTADSYMFATRHKYKNLYVKPTGCGDMSKCPVKYPTCENCKMLKNQ